MTTIPTPFAIGQQWWAPVTYPRQVEVPCPVCFGQLAVVVILGDGERISVCCEACGKGFDGPRGIVHEWNYAPGAEAFEIAGVASMHQGRWTVESTTGQSRQFEELRETEAEAIAESVKRCAAQYESNMQTRQYKRRAVKEATWSVQYHRKQIAELTRQIEWHQSKLQARQQADESARATNAVAGSGE